MLTLAQAAALTGMAGSSILRAIKRGVLSGTRQDDGTWLGRRRLAPRLFRERSAGASQRLPRPDCRAGERDYWKTRARSVARQQLAMPTLQSERSTLSPQFAAERPDCAALGDGWARPADGRVIQPGRNPQ
jgi:hypothetical protein